MRFKNIEVRHPPKLHRIRSIEDLSTVEFVDGLAEVEVPIELLHDLPLKHDERNDSPRLNSVMRSIRAKGYSSLDPIVCRIGARGRWVVIDGGHRLTAAQLVAKEFWTNLWGRDLGDVTFFLYETESSNSRLSEGQVPSRPTSTDP
ncbi:MAG: ParB N-terminal domain-containing protein [Pseudomonadota bacterium]